MPNSKASSRAFRRYIRDSIKCGFCEYSSTSYRAMRLHAKYTHGEDLKEEDIENGCWKCTYCRKPLAECLCRR